MKKHFLATLSLVLSFVSVEAESPQAFWELFQSSRFLSESIANFDDLSLQIEKQLQDESQFLYGIVKLHALVIAEEQITQLLASSKGSNYLRHRIRILSDIARRRILEAHQEISPCVYALRPILEKNSELGFLFQDEFSEMRMILKQISSSFKRPKLGSIVQISKTDKEKFLLDFKKYYQDSLISLIYLIYSSPTKIAEDVKLQQDISKTLEAAYACGERHFSELLGNFYRTDLVDLVGALLDLQVDNQLLFNDSVTRLALENLLLKMRKDGLVAAGQSTMLSFNPTNGLSEVNANRLEAEKLLKSSPAEQELKNLAGKVGTVHYVSSSSFNRAVRSRKEPSIDDAAQKMQKSAAKRPRPDRKESSGSSLTSSAIKVIDEISKNKKTEKAKEVQNQPLQEIVDIAKEAAERAQSSTEKEGPDEDIVSFIASAKINVLKNLGLSTDSVGGENTEPSMVAKRTVSRRPRKVTEPKTPRVSRKKTAEEPLENILPVEQPVIKTDSLGEEK